MEKQLYPILEFDEDKNAFIRPEHTLTPGEAPKRCVLCFFAEAIEEILAECPHRVIAQFKSESQKLPIYEIEYKGVKLTLIQALVGAPMAAGQVDELTARGGRVFMACGGCGVLDKDLAVGHLIVPVAAVRDEGTSYHYIRPSREAEADSIMTAHITKALDERDVPYVTGKTWTTDAFYRETPAKIALRRAEGCIAVDMEASAFMAAAQYNGVRFGQILYAGDSLGGESWDKRDWHNRTDIRTSVLRLTLDICAGIEA